MMHTKGCATALDFLRVCVGEGESILGVMAVAGWDCDSGADR